MYHVISNDGTKAVQYLKWVKLLPNGVFAHCDEAEGQGVVVDDEIYHVEGKPAIDRPTVRVVWESEIVSQLQDKVAELTALIRLQGQMQTDIELKQYEQGALLESISGKLEGGMPNGGAN